MRREDRLLIKALEARIAGLRARGFEVVSLVVPEDMSVPLAVSAARDALLASQEAQDASRGVQQVEGSPVPAVLSAGSEGGKVPPPRKPTALAVEVLGRRTASGDPTLEGIALASWITFVCHPWVAESHVGFFRCANPKWRREGLVGEVTYSLSREGYYVERAGTPKITVLLGSRAERERTRRLLERAQHAYRPSEGDVERRAREALSRTKPLAYYDPAEGEDRP